jgi:putative hydrolase of HD superfamily
MQINAEEVKGVLSYLSEMLSLSHLKRSGWRRYGISEENRETVADHVFCTTQIALILASLEKVPEEKWGEIALMALLHDNAETRLGDLDRIATLYIKRQRASQKALRDQVAILPEALKNKFLILSKKLDEDTMEAQIVRDADILEFALRACIFAQRGYGTKKDAKTSLLELSTESAKAILRQAMKEKNLVGLWSQKLGLSREDQ